ncbi:MAG: CoA-disulfide reductase [Bacillota bacterium]|uniref:CoA-disulfide reductase n=1 Tax=Virgibacillus salarius TaxID=447199 RepID=A0A941DVY1_9BACI|nr:MULTISPECIES: CoA-disulfide reductase [Bacillaceae]NAZ07924.1 CoA-disulfide reductase [Agaribacter marinus]MBR7795208.1 CoA-disulfide reductase [Virgibacillus salarius]MCC2251989.1 CoA-disulfide reductase [Virgibacillus sp. AGTR]MDY7044549.1 CoA-disulfide reductase [Virgibacillus sp. M23]QRZ19922.1 CoA-disulfide reductase [Virgibacillus sp. AGTR]
MAKKILIVGGVGGGATVAAQIRRANKEDEIILLEKGGHVSFSNCGMPYYIGGTIENRDAILYSKEKFSEKFQVEVRTFTEVTAIDRSNKEITYCSKTGNHQETYNTLILSPGASAVMPSIKGMNRERTFSLHTIPDMDAIHAYIETNQPKSAAVIGGGFVGLEMIENLHAKGITCKLIDRSEQVMNVIDADMARIVQEYLTKKNIEVRLNDGLHHFSNDGKLLHVNSGGTIQADLTIMAVGIRPNTKLAVDASLEIGKTGAILVNTFMQTSDPSIYALGDVVETKDPITGHGRNIALAGPAHRQAFVIANHLNGKPITYNGTYGTNILKLFDLTIGSTGHNSDSLEAYGKSYDVATLQSLSNASYYPGADKLWIKVLFDKQHGTILGGQVVGHAGVDKRLAVLATAIKGKLTVFDLSDLELGYAPPYSSPKDPINILGYKASSKLEQ